MIILFPYRELMTIFVVVSGVKNHGLLNVSLLTVQVLSMINDHHPFLIELWVRLLLDAVVVRTVHIFVRVIVETAASDCVSMLKHDVADPLRLLRRELLRGV